jgi:hypothetical protein
MIRLYTPIDKFVDSFPMISKGFKWPKSKDF